jgi:hypothetical protein
MDWHDRLFKPEPSRFKAMLQGNQIRPASLEDVNMSRRPLFAHPYTGQLYIALGRRAILRQNHEPPI